MGCRKLQLNNQFFFVDSDEKEPHPCKFVFIRGSEECLSSDHTFVSSVSSVCAYSYNANDQLTLESNSLKGDTVYSYDANGSMIGKVNDTQNESYLYVYNLQNRLSTANIARMEDTSLVEITSSYVYNQSGIRVRSNTSTTIDKKIWGQVDYTFFFYLLFFCKLLVIACELR